MLTDLAIQKIEPHPTQRVEHFDKDGLFLVVQPLPSGHKSWAFRYRTPAKKRRKLTLGDYGDALPALTLAEARKRARKAQTLVDEGGDPAADKINERRDRADAERKADAERFEMIAETFLQECIKAPPKGDKDRDPTKHQYESRRIVEKLIVPEFTGKPLAAITKREVKDLLKRIARKTPPQANRVWATLSRLFNWALGEDLISVSPMAGVERPAEETSRKRVLDNDEVRRIWEACDALDVREAAFVRLAFLTAARRGELLGLTWKEIDLDAGTWTMEGVRTKNDVAHVLPLMPEALTILAAVPKIAAPGKDRPGLVLTVSGITPLSNLSKLKAKLDKALAEDGGPAMEGWTFHDVRRSVASNLAARRVPPFVVEAVLNHQSGAKAGVAGVYNRYVYMAEKTIALGVWAARLREILTGTTFPPEETDYELATALRFARLKKQVEEAAARERVVPIDAGKSKRRRAA